MHNFKKVYDLVQGDYENWCLDGNDIKGIAYVSKGDYIILIFICEDAGYSKMFVRRYTHDIEDDDQYVGPGVCFYSDTHIEFREEANTYTLKKKEQDD